MTKTRIVLLSLLMALLGSLHPAFIVHALRTDGFALGGVGTYPRRGCNTGGGYEAYWAIRHGEWKEVIGTQEAVDCVRLEKLGFPSELGVHECWDGDQVCRTTTADSLSPGLGRRRWCRLPCAIRHGHRKPVIANHDAWPCDRLVEFGVSGEIGIHECNDGVQLVPYDHP